jgi:hypothetical protein
MRSLNRKPRIIRGESKYAASSILRVICEYLVNVLPCDAGSREVSCFAQLFLSQSELEFLVSNVVRQSMLHSADETASSSGKILRKDFGTVKGLHINLYEQPAGRESKL